MAKLGKVSFHPGLNWQFRVGTAVQRLAPPLSLADGWMHALELRFLITPNCFLPIEDRERDVPFAEIAEGENLIVNILWAPDGQAAGDIPAMMGGQAIWRHRLSGGESVAVTSRAMPMSESDTTLADEVISKLRVNFRKPPVLSDTFIEAEWMSFHPQNGNVVVIIPVDSRVVGVEPSAAT